MVTAEAPELERRLPRLTADRLLPLALALVAAAVVAMYFVNRPAADTYPDSSGYLQGASGLLHGHVFSVLRLPGYPALLAVLGGTFGWFGPVMAVQAAMFVACTVITYQVVLWTFGRAWIAALAGFVIATDAFAAAYAKAILSEALAMLLVTAMAAACVRFTLKPRAALLWLIASLATLAMLTRPEWSFFPAVLAAYLAFTTWQRGIWRTLWRPGLTALAACYVVLGAYVAGNALTNGFVGTTDVTNLSLLGKVMQYHMEGEAPPSMAATAQLVETYDRAGKSVWILIAEHPEFARDHNAMAGTFARAVIARDPLGFLQSSVDVAVLRSADYDPQFATYVRSAPLGRLLLALQYLVSARHFVLFLTPVAGIVWLVASLLSRGRSSLDALGPVALIVLYGTAITALGGFDEYGRYHVVFTTATVALTWGTLGFNAQVAWSAYARLKIVSLVAAGLILGEVWGARVLPFIAEPGVRLALIAVLIAAQGAVVILSRRVPALQSLPVTDR